ncbi:cyclin-dependent kinase inhibitor 1-like [Haliotis rubra]|uniref:cyclin-dependent kinase inhibitor 1-like n=1 Tax=Haliotis rubra TaxID=36100 RepID=UPI001EE51B1F|nr:cyclin-dependent kinase inhibitor 1-like [Haliotis rubra]
MAIRGPVSLKKPVRRCLFGAPDHERIRKDLDRALSDMDRSTKADMKNNWGFDIETDSGVPGGRYEITEVKEDEYVPSFYRKGYSTKSRRVRDRSSVNMVSSGTQVDNTTSTAVTTVSSSTQAGRGLDSPLSPALAGAVVNGVRRLDFKENDFHVSGTNTSTNQRSRTRSVVPSSFHQSTMKDHYQPRKRRSPDIDTSLPRGKSPRL